MNLHHLKGSGFAGIDDMVLDLSGSKVHVILGPCGSGKSSIRDLIRWVFTGLCRGLTKKNEAHRLAPKNKSPHVEIGADDIHLIRTATSTNLPASEILELFGRPEMIGAVVDAFDFIGMPPAARAELVRALSADPAKLAALAVAELTKLKLPAEDVQAIAGLVGRNLDKAEEYAVQKRRDCKRKLDEIPANAPDSAVEIDGAKFDLKAASVTEIDDRAAGLRRERKAADDQRVKTAEALGRAKQAADPAERNARTAALAAELEALGHCDNKDVDAAEKARAAAAKVESDLKTSRDQALAAYNQAVGAKESAGERLAAAEKLKGKCPTCGHKMTAEDTAALITEIETDGNAASENMNLAKVRGVEVKIKLEAATAKLLQLAEAVVALRAKALKAEGLRVEIAALRQRAAENKDAAEVGKLAGQVEALTKQIAELDARLDLGAKVLAAKQAYDTTLAAYESGEALKVERDAWDRAQKLLGAGGPVRRMAAAGFDLEAVNAHVAQLLPGGKVYNENWALSYWDEARGARPVEMCSRSERFRLGCAFAAALSKAAGLGLLVLDEADILAGPARADFMGWLESIGPDFERVIVMATRADRAGLVPAEGFTFWWVEAGSAEPVTAEAVTA